MSLELLLLNFAVHFSVSLYVPQNAELRPEYLFIRATAFVYALLQWLNIVLHCLYSTPASPKHFSNFLRTFLNAILTLQLTRSSAILLVLCLQGLCFILEGIEMFLTWFVCNQCWLLLMSVGVFFG